MSGGAPPKLAIYAGTGSGVFKSMDGGKNWSAVHTANGVCRHQWQSGVFRRSAFHGGQAPLQSVERLPHEPPFAAYGPLNPEESSKQRSIIFSYLGGVHPEHPRRARSQNSLRRPRSREEHASFCFLLPAYCSLLLASCFWLRLAHCKMSGIMELFSSTASAALCCGTVLARFSHQVSQ